MSSGRLTWSRRTGRAITHGTFTGYNVHGCRCTECWSAYSESEHYQQKLEIKRMVTAQERR